MTASEMYSRVGLRLNKEAPEREFYISERLAFLNEAQLYVADKMPIEKVRQLENVSDAQAVDANGAIDLTALSPTILNGDRGVLDVLHSSGYYCSGPLDEEDRREVTELSITFPSSRPAFWFIGTGLYLNPYTYGSTTGVIRYKGTPTAITDSVACALNDDIQDIIVEYAVYIGLKTLAASEGSNARLNAALSVKAMAEGMISSNTNNYTAPRRIRFEVGQMNGNNYGGSDIKTRGRY